jgi:hypothetical protein
MRTLEELEGKRYGWARKFLKYEENVPMCPWVLSVYPLGVRPVCLQSGVVALLAYESIEHGLACLELFFGGLGPSGVVSTFWGTEGVVTGAHLIVELRAGILFFRFSATDGKEN